MVGVSSFDAVDVVYAVMEGATKLIHGVLPYGHMPPGIIHGDTYPILSYALYAPLACSLRSTRSGTRWTRARGRRRSQRSCAAWAVFRVAAGGPPAAPRIEAGRDEEAGLRAALGLAGVPAAADHRLDRND